MRQSLRLPSLWAPAVVAMAGAVGACHTAPTQVAPLSGEFPLVVWNSFAVPVSLGALPPDTSNRQVQGGALILNASTHMFSYWYVTRNSRGFTMDSVSEAGLFTQNGSSIAFTIESFAVPVGRFAGEILSDRIVITNYSPEMEFRRPGG